MIVPGAQIAPDGVVRERQLIAAADAAIADVERPAADVEVIGDDDELDPVSAVSLGCVRSRYPRAG